MDAVIASSCSVCAENPTPLWEIRAARVTHDQAQRELRFEGAQFRFAGVPLVYLPSLRLPDPTQTRARGFLVPRFRASSRLGYGATLPYFIPLDAQRDITLAPTLTTDRLVALSFRYRQAFARGGLEIGGQVARDRLRPGRTRGHLFTRGQFQLPQDFTLRFDILAGSDRDYLEDYDVVPGARLTSDVTLERIRRDQAIRARALGFYSLRQIDRNRRLPRAALQMRWQERIGLAHLPIGGALNLDFGAQAHGRAAADASVPSEYPARALLRLHAQAEWRRQWFLAGGVLMTGAAQGRLDHVRVDGDPRFPDPLTRHAAQAMIELRWPWSAVDARGGRHVIQPIAQVVASHQRDVALPNDDNRMPEFDAGNLFALDRYWGHDARDDGTRVNLGLQWSRFDPDGWSLDTLVGRIWRRDSYAGFPPGTRQALGDRQSNWLVAARLSLPEGLSFGVRALVDPDGGLDRGEARLSWSNRRTEISTALLRLPASDFEDRPDDLRDWTVDVGHRFTSGWAGRVGGSYDFQQSRFGVARAGLEFRNECLLVDLSLSRRFATSTNVTPSTRFDLRIELLGIGGRSAAGSGRSCAT
nr:LPS assembly protein LptD [Pararhodobacter sp. SW119]